MDSKSMIKRYIGPKPTSLVLAVALLAGAAVLGILGLAVPGLDSGMYYVLAMFAALTALLPLSVALPVLKNTKKCLAVLEARGELDKAANQLAPDRCTVLGKDHMRLGSDYLFCKNRGLAVKYEDVLWCYKRVVRSGLITSASALILNTRDAKEIPAFVVRMSDKSDKLGQAAELLAEKNPNILFGFSRENQLAYKSLCKRK